VQTIIVVGVMFWVAVALLVALGLGRMVARRERQRPPERPTPTNGCACPDASKELGKAVHARAHRHPRDHRR
jgi:hypothetical protein